MSGITPNELNIVEPCTTILYIVDMFYDIKRESGIKITYAELESYCRLKTVTLSPDEITAIIKLDDRYERGIQ